MCLNFDIPSRYILFFSCFHINCLYLQLLPSCKITTRLAGESDVVLNPSSL